MNKSPIAHASKICRHLNQMKDFVWIEIGVNQGTTAQFVLSNFNVKQAVLIDPYCEWDLLATAAETRKAQALSLLEPYRNKIEWHFQPSTCCAHSIEQDFGDVLFIDGDHSYQPVAADLDLYVSKIRPGGLIICDDSNEPGVAQAVSEFLQGTDIKPFFTQYKTSKKHQLELTWWLNG